jgi:hypothetical protein
VEKTADLLELIHRDGYWRVDLRPPIFQKARLRDKDNCRYVVYETAVATEGWRYPIIDDDLYDQGTDWIAGAANQSVFIEYWRLYQSGQFIHHLALREDHMGRLGLFHPQFFVPGKGKRYLAVTASICMITDIIEFAARLAYREILVPQAVICLELHKMAGRELTYMMPGRRLPGSFWFKDESVRLEHIYSSEELIGRPRDIAGDLAIELFRNAGWDAPRSLVMDDQSRYTAARR